MTELWDIKLFDAETQEWILCATSNDFDKAWKLATEMKHADRYIPVKIVKRAKGRKVDTYYV